MDSDRRAKRFGTIGGLTFLLILGIFLLSLKRVDSGQVGIVPPVFSEKYQDPRDIKIHRPGIHFVAPWEEMLHYKSGEQVHRSKMNLLTINAKDVKLRTKLHYRVLIDSLGHIYNEIGKNHKQKIIIPALRQACRRLIGYHNSQELQKKSTVEDLVAILEGRKDLVHEGKKKPEADLAQQLKEGYVKLHKVRIEKVKVIEESKGL